MKKSIKLAKTAYVGYIYSDGHAVILHRENHPKAGEVEWAEIIENLDIHCNFAGRIVFHHLRYDRKFRLALEAYELRCSEPSLENGSENTKRLSIPVGNFSIGFKDGGELSWALTSLISEGITYQPDMTEAFNPDWNERFSVWGSTRIAKIHRTPKAVEAESVAA